MGESAMSEFSQKLDITIFKPSVIFGRGDGFINLFANLVKWFPVIPLAKPAAQFQPIWVEDVAQCFVNALENTTTFGHNYELGGPTVYSLQELVKKVAGILGKSPVIIGLSHRISLLQAFGMELMPVKLMSRDNVRSMLVDSVCDQLALGLMQNVLGVKPTALEVVAPEYLLNDTPRNAYNQFRTAAGRAISVRR
jgi:NADH dehydrogenase